MKPLIFTFNKGPDVITVYIWCWLKNLFTANKTGAFHSRLLNGKFSEFQDYYYQLGKKDALVEVLLNKKTQGIRGLSFIEVISRLAGSELGMGCGVILFNINTYELGRISDRFPGADLSVFKDDFVILPAKSKNHASKILEKISPALANAVAVQSGFIFDSNDGGEE